MATTVAPERWDSPTMSGKPFGFGMLLRGMSRSGPRRPCLFRATSKMRPMAPSTLMVHRSVQRSDVDGEILRPSSCGVPRFCGHPSKRHYGLGRESQNRGNSTEPLGRGMDVLWWDTHDCVVHAEVNRACSDQGTSGGREGRFDGYAPAPRESSTSGLRRQRADSRGRDRTVSRTAAPVPMGRGQPNWV